jgi:hypothetical protein
MSKQIKSQNESRNPSVMINTKFWAKYDQIANPQGSEKNKQNFLFQRMVDLFMLSLVHGFKEGLKASLPSAKKDIFRWSNFKESDEIIINAISILDTTTDTKSDPKIINSKVARLKIIQEYANGGFLDLIKKLEDGPDFEANFITLLTDELE